MIETPNYSKGGSYKRRQPGGWPPSAVREETDERFHNNLNTMMMDDTHTISSAGNVSVNTLAAFLIESSSQTNNNEGSIHRPRPSMDARRQKQMENQAVINALNQFILQAGNIYKGKRLSNIEASRLREAADHVGLSREVVDALLEQTANPNAVVDYCMRSDDAFARKITEDPTLSRILRKDCSYAGRDGLNLSSSVWRVFMHKIIQQFLKNQHMELGDVMDKSSLTRRLYEEALQEGPNTSESDENNFHQANMLRDYTEERKHVFISEEEAKRARMEAEARMEFHPRVPFDDLIHRSSILMLPQTELPPGLRDDDLSLVPCAVERQRHEPPRHQHSRRQSMPAAFSGPARDTTTANFGQESAVKRGLAIFEKSSDSESNSQNRKPRRKSDGHTLSSTVLQRRALFEKGSTSSSLQANQGIMDVWQNDKRSQSGSDQSRPSTTRRLSSSRLALFSTDPLSDTSNGLPSHVGPNFPSKSSAAGQVSKSNSSRLHNFQNPEKPGGWSDSTITSFSKDRRKHRKSPGKLEARAVDLYNHGSTVLESSDGQSRMSLPGHNHQAQSRSANGLSQDSEVVRHTAASVFSKPDVICLDHQNEDYVKEVFSGLTQTSSTSNGFVEQQSVPSLQERHKHGSNTGKISSTKRPRGSKRFHVDDSGTSWVGFDNSGDFDGIHLTSKGKHSTSQPTYDSRVTEKIAPQTDSKIPTKAKQQAWDKAFTNRKKPNLAPKTTTPEPQKEISYQNASMSGSYVHSFPTSPTVVTNATSSVPRHSSAVMSTINQSMHYESRTGFDSQAHRVSMDPETEWTNFGGSSFAEHRQAKSEESSSENDRYMSAYSSDGNKSSTSKPRKYFQKLLNNEIRSPLSGQDSQEWASNSTEEHREGGSSYDELNVQSSRKQKRKSTFKLNNRNYQGMESDQLRRQAQATTPRWGNDHESGQSWEAFGTNYNTQQKLDDERTPNERDKQYSSMTDDAKHKKRGNHLYSKQQDRKIKQDSKPSGTRADQHTTDQFTAMAQLSNNGKAVFVQPNLIPNRVQDLVQRHERRSKTTEKTPSVKTPRTSIHNLPYNHTLQSNDSNMKIGPNQNARPSLESTSRARNRKQGGELEIGPSSAVWSAYDTRGSIGHDTGPYHANFDRNERFKEEAIHSSEPRKERKDSVASTDLFALREFRQRRDSMEPSLPIQKGNVELKRKILEQNQGKGVYFMEEDEIDSLKDFLHGYEYDANTERKHPLSPPTLLGNNRSRNANSQHYSKMQQRNYAMDLESKESSSSLSNILQVDTASTEEDDDVGLNSPHEIDWPSERASSQNRGIVPSSPTAFRSSDSAEDEVDEAEIRAAAKQNGIPDPVIEILIRQSKEAQRRDHQVGQTLTGIAKYDSDTGLPASTRHLYNSSNQTLGFNTGRTWDTVEEDKCDWPVPAPNKVLQSSPCTNFANQNYGKDLLRPDPSPVAGLGRTRSSTPVPAGVYGMDPISQQGYTATEVPEGTTSEDLKLLNSFIEVASGNFGGNKLSAESESRVRAAAFKIGLTPKFVDQILKQQQEKSNSNPNDPFTYEKPSESLQQPPPAYHNYYGQPQRPQTYHSSAPYGYGGEETYVGETSTYYSADMTRTTKRTKKTEENEGCNAWDTWETIRSNIGLALAKACGTNTNTNGDDGSSISSAVSWDENAKGPKKHRRRRRSERGKRRESHYSQRPQHHMAVDSNIRMEAAHTPTAAVAVTGTPCNQSVRGYV